VAGCSAVRPRNLLIRVRRPQVGELGEQITVGPLWLPETQNAAKSLEFWDSSP